MTNVFELHDCGILIILLLTIHNQGSDTCYCTYVNICTHLVMNAAACCSSAIPQQQGSATKYFEFLAMLLLTFAFTAPRANVILVASTDLDYSGKS